KKTVEGHVDDAARRLPEVAGVVDAVHQHQQRVKAQLAAAEHSSESTGSAAAHTAPAAAEGVELIYEHDASAPSLGPALGHAHGHEHVERVHAEEHALERRAGGDDDRHVHRGCDALGEHGLAGAGRADHQHPALPLATRLDVEPALLHQAQDPAHLLDRGLLAANVLDPDFVVRLAGIDVCAADAAVDEERAKEKHEVDDHQGHYIDEVGQQRAHELRQRGDRFVRDHAEDDVRAREI